MFVIPGFVSMFELVCSIFIVNCMRLDTEVLFHHRAGVVLPQTGDQSVSV